MSHYLVRTVGKRINVVLRGRRVSQEEATVDTREVTHDPEKPSLHRSQRHPNSRVLKNVREEKDGNPKRRVEIVEDEAKRSEECLHHQEDQVNDQVIGPETSSGPIQACHEVDDDVVDEYSSCRERNICEHVGDRIGRSSVHAVARLQRMN